MAAVEEATAPGKLMSILHYFQIRLQDMGFVQYSFNVFEFKFHTDILHSGLFGSLLRSKCKKKIFLKDNSIIFVKLT